MPKKLKPGQRCTNSSGCCEDSHYFHPPFDKLPMKPGEVPRCPYVEPVPGRPAPRAEVYAAIDGERDYQDQLWGESAGLTIGEFILLLSEYVDRAKHEWSTEKKPEMRALDVVRKVAGIAVNCMERHGAPRRVG